MIKLTYAHLNNTPIEQVLNKLATCSKLDVRTAYQISKHIYHLQKEIKHARQVFTDMLKKHADLDEKGGFKKLPESDGIVFADKAAYDADLSKFLEIEFEYDRRLLALEELAGAELSPQELMALEPILVQE